MPDENFTGEEASRVDEAEQVANITDILIVDAHVNSWDAETIAEWLVKNFNVLQKIMKDRVK